jgi:hypothetical protein
MRDSHSTQIFSRHPIERSANGNQNRQAGLNGFRNGLRYSHVLHVTIIAEARRRLTVKNDTSGPLERDLLLDVVVEGTAPW